MKRAAKSALEWLRRRRSKMLRKGRAESHHRSSEERHPAMKSFEVEKISRLFDKFRSS